MCRVCKKCGGTKYYASGHCKVCHATHVRSWDSRNRDIKNANTAKWKKNNPEKWKIKSDERVKLFRAANPHKVNALTAKRRANKLNATPSWSNSFFVNEAYALAKLREEKTGKKWHVDHIVPLQSKLVCGLHAHTNIQVILASENIEKNNRHWPEMP